MPQSSNVRNGSKADMRDVIRASWQIDCVRWSPLAISEGCGGVSKRGAATLL